MTITKEFVLATIEGIHALRFKACDIENDPQAKGDDGAARMLKARAENDKQAADLLSGWVRRNAEKAGLNHNDYDLDN